MLRRVAIRVAPGEAEIVLARLLELFPGGLEERAGEGWVELAVYTDAEGEDALRRELGSVSSEPVEPGWEDRWREFHRPVRVGGLWIGPPWEEAPPGEPSVVVDPGRAFGTGANPTTRTCIELLSGLAIANTRRLLALWHSIHIPIGMALFTAAIFHILGALYYSTLLR